MGVMTPQAPQKRSTLPRIRFHPFCAFGHHKPEHYRLRAVGETWTTFVYTCMRCNRVVGNSHAARSDKPVK